VQASKISQAGAEGSSLAVTRSGHAATLNSPSSIETQMLHQNMDRLVETKSVKISLNKKERCAH
jgi:hypothetical protein